MAEPKLPRGALRLAAEAMEDHGDPLDSEWANAKIALTAALPVIQRDALRQAARQILALDAEDHARHRDGPNKGPWNSMRATINRLARGEPLRDLPAKTDS